MNSILTIIEAKSNQKQIPLFQEASIDAPLDPATSSTSRLILKTIIEGKEVTVKNAEFVTETQITVIIDEVQYYYNRTKKDYKGKMYFQCINRKHSENNGKNACLEQIIAWTRITLR